jgi:hypothetical protein
VKHFVAEVVKTFGPEHVIAESLDDFRYGNTKNTTKKCFTALPERASHYSPG